MAATRSRPPCRRTRSRGKRSYTPLVIIETTPLIASSGCTTVCHSVKLKNRSEPSEEPFKPHELVGGERDVEILQQLPDRVVVAVAEIAMVEVVVARPEAADAQVVVGVLDLLDGPRDVVQRHRSPTRAPGRRSSPASPGPSGCRRAPSPPASRGRCRRSTGRTRGRRSTMTSTPSTSSALATRSPVKPSTTISSPYLAIMSSVVQLMAFWNWP